MTLSTILIAWPIAGFVLISPLILRGVVQTYQDHRKRETEGFGSEGGIITHDGGNTAKTEI